MTQFQYPGRVQPIFTGPEVTHVDKWFQPLSLPVPRRGMPTQDQAAYFAPVSIAKETTTVDRWYQPLSLPVPPRQGLAAHEQQTLAWSGFTPPVVTTVVMGWLPSLEVPRLPQRPQPTSGAVAPVSTARETTSVDRWYQALSLPVRRTGMPVAEHGAFWSPGFTAPSFGWYQDLSRPPGVRPGLSAADQLAFAWSNFTPSAAVVPNMAGWFVSLSAPYPYKTGLGAPYQQAYFSYVSMEPGTVIIPPSGTVPGPSDGADDRRRKWLEWSADRKRKQQLRPVVAQPVIQVAKPKPPAPIVPKTDVLSKNVEAVRAQQAGLSAMQGILRAELAQQNRAEMDRKRLELARQQQDDDDDEALSMLLGE